MQDTAIYLAFRPKVSLYDRALFLIHQYAMVIMIGHLPQGQGFRRDGQQSAFHGRHLQYKQGQTNTCSAVVFNVRARGPAPYRSACRRMDVYDTLDIRTRGVDGRVESETSLVDSKVGAAPVHYFTLEINLHLESTTDNRKVNHNNSLSLFSIVYLKRSEFI